MSADTYIYIDRKTFEVWMCTASCVCRHKRHCYTCQKGSLIGKGKTFEKACEIAEWNNGLDCEYGISFKLWCK